MSAYSTTTSFLPSSVSFASKLTRADLLAVVNPAAVRVGDTWLGPAGGELQCLDLGEYPGPHLLGP